MGKILEYFGILIIIFAVAFGVSSGIVEGWVLFWEYGWIYNDVTVPPMVLWDIFFSNILIIVIMAGIITPSASIAIYIITTY